MIGPAPVAIAAGVRLGPYEIVAPLGVGGMGEVYKARDTRIDRTVAIKVLRPELSADPVNRARLRREARAIGRLNHPHICVLHDVSCEDGTDFLVLEFVEGDTLDQSLQRGPLPLDRVLRYAIEIADALDHAHRHGIVHRDLKPSNIVLTSSGVKLLDFGIARWHAAEFTLVFSTSTTQTDEARIVGTPNYMAPEQIEGKSLDARTDIFAFGCVLYEMLTARKAFEGGSSAMVLAAILEREPPLATLVRPGTPALIDHIVKRCLARNPDDRWRAAHDIRLALEGSYNHSSASVDAEAVVKPRSILRPGRIKSLVVLPLAHQSGDPEHDYFADGMTEALIADLAQISALLVISRTSAMQYRNVHKPLPEIAKELNVDGLIEGSVLRVGERVRITVQLIHGATDAHLWAKSYEGSVRDVFALQSEVARAIAGEIKIRLTPRERLRLARAQQVQPDAHEAYLRGRHYWSKVTEEGFCRALDHLRVAVAIDPSFAMAQAALADVYIALGAFGVLMPKEAFSNARTATLRALAADPKLADAHRTLALVKMCYDWDWSGAEAAFRLAMRCQPGSAEVYAQYAVYLVALGRCDEAVVGAERARALDPLSLMINNDLAFALWTAGRDREAIDQYRRTLELDSSFVESRRELGVMYAHRGDFDAAVAELQRAAAGARDTETLALLGHALGLAGRRLEAQQILAELGDLSGTRYVSPFDIALIQLALGQLDDAFASLERAYEDRSTGLIFLKSWPLLDPIRSDRRFEDLLRRVGLVEGSQPAH